ncbi:hypothetical protein NDU88_002008 [Pleurodeles waltl]|uniref:Uncharacterized protein n=1 Tax=Pleurodeles waltl TaxID=8319 RepID=A0AAV7TKS9_PLEWA|nr:hypothetical protein NDU88_002008 [Pleurodeles waltl]
MRATLSRHGKGRSSPGAREKRKLKALCHTGIRTKAKAFRRLKHGLCDGARGPMETYSDPPRAGFKQAALRADTKGLKQYN